MKLQIIIYKYTWLLPISIPLFWKIKFKHEIEKNIWYYKSYATWRDNQWQKENWSFNLLDTCQKESAEKIDQYPQMSSFRFLQKMFTNVH